MDESTRTEPAVGGEESTGVGGTLEAKPDAETDALAKVSSLLSVRPEQLAPAIEAILLTLDRPVQASRLAEALGLVHDAEDAEEAEVRAEADAGAQGKKRKGKTDRASTPVGIIRGAIDLLNESYAKTERSFRIESVAGGFRLMTLPKFGAAVEAFHGKRQRHALTRAAVETLAIIAYKQPLTRAGLEAIRGVACGEVLRSLMERRLVTIVGRAEEVGRPMLYGTTKAFLETFGLASIKDLPTADELKARVGEADD